MERLVTLLFPFGRAVAREQVDLEPAGLVDGRQPARQLAQEARKPRRQRLSLAHPPDAFYGAVILLLDDAEDRVPHYRVRMEAGELARHRQVYLTERLLHLVRDEAKEAG